MGWALDIFTVLIIAVMIFQCARRGFVRTVIELIGYIVSLVLSFTLSSALSQFIYKTFLRPPMIQAVEKQLSTAASGNVQSAVSGIFANLPGYITNAAGSFGVSDTNITAQIEGNISKGAAEAAPMITDYIAEKIVVSLLSFILLFVLFFAFMIVVRIVANLINKAFSVPVIGTANKILGGAVGIVKGFIIIFVISALLGLILPLTKDGIWIINQAAIDDSVLFKAISGFNPLLK